MDGQVEQMSEPRPTHVSHEAVVLGLGYVGWPLVEELAIAGFTVIAVDTSASVVEARKLELTVTRSQSRHGHPGSLIPSIHVVEEIPPAERARVYVICVPTPLDHKGIPDLGSVTSATRSIADRLRVGDLVILESTSYPGTTEEVVAPILESSGLTRDTDFLLAFSSERINPGDTQHDLRSTPKVVGASSEGAIEAAVAFYSLICTSVVTAKGVKEAELSKLIENSYRLLNISFVNELAMVARELGVDLRDAIRCAATKPFGFQAFWPGAGVGGHCIPVDPGYLEHWLNRAGVRSSKLLSVALEVNLKVPEVVASRCLELLDHLEAASTVCIVGVAYKSGVSDTRNAPAEIIGRRLLEAGVEVVFTDKMVRDWAIARAAVRRLPSIRDALQKDVGLFLVLNRVEGDDAVALRDSNIQVLDLSGTVDGSFAL